MVRLNAPTNIPNGEPFLVAYKADERVAGRLRITAGKDTISFTLLQDGKEPRTGDGHRIRGREGAFTVADWGDHVPGTELVLRFEGAKLWMTVI